MRVDANPTVLIVEDDPALRSLFRLILQSAGFAVVTVEDGLGALNHLESNRPDAVVLDISLPRVDGRDVFRELAARPDTKGVPIVVVSGSDISDLNPDDFACILKKPIDPGALVAAVENCLRRKLSGLV